MIERQYTERQYTGDTGNARIAFNTDVWLRDENGEDVDLNAAFDALGIGRDPDNTCPSECVPPGIFAPVNTAYCIERCDLCERYTGDFEAAEALAAMLGPDVTVWYYEDAGESDA